MKIQADFFEDLEKKLGELKKRYETEILEGGCRSMERYQHLLGCVHGIEEARHLLWEEEKKYLEQ